MKRGTIIWVVVIIVLIAAGIAIFFAFKGKGTPPESQVTGGAGSSKGTVPVKSGSGSEKEPKKTIPRAARFLLGPVGVLWGIFGK